MKLLWVSILPGILAAEPQERPAYRVEVDAVRVDVFVSRNGTAVQGLSRDDFELFDNGVPQEIELVRRDREPLNVALVLDVSDSVAGAPLSQLKAAAHAFLRGLDAVDRAMLVPFSHYIYGRTRLTQDFAALHEGIDGLRAGGRTSWHDALFAGLELLDGSPGRPLVLLFTDGEDTYSWLDEEQLARIVRQSSPVVYAISQDTSSRILGEVARLGGGRLIEAETDELKAAFQRVLSEMKSRYLLTYHPQGVEQKGWHSIRVELRGRKGEVRARRGYFYR